MIRESQEELKRLFAEGKNVYSFSKLNIIDNCLFGAYKTYVLHEKGQNNIYGLAGGKIHDVLEQIMNNEATEDDLLPTLEKELVDFEMLGIDFPKDRNGGTSIRDGWIANMTDFCKKFTRPKGNFETETFLLYKVDDDHYMQGYCDLTKIIDQETKTVSIYDWKTSSQFTKADLVHHGRQLVIYQMAYEQMGYTVKETAWIMLKYVSVTYRAKKTSRSKEESIIEKVCERRKVVSDLKDVIEAKLIKLGYDELDIECMMSEALEAQSFDLLPEDLKAEFTIKPYVRKYEVTDELKKECLEFINETMGLWESLNEEEWEYPPRKFTKLQRNGKEVDDIFFCTSLCNHKGCPHLKKYLETKTSNSEYDDLF